MTAALAFDIGLIALLGGRVEFDRHRHDHPDGERRRQPMEVGLRHSLGL